jgi:hypothetical protein
MFILLKHNNNYKGILVIAHVEGIFFEKNINLINDLSKKYYIYNHYSSWKPDIKLNFEPCVYYTENIFNNLYNLETINNYLIPYISNINSSFEFNIKKKMFDFICLNRCCEYKKTYETLELMIYMAKKYNSKSLLFLYINNTPSEYLNKIYNLYNNLCNDIKSKIILFHKAFDINNSFIINDTLSNKIVAYLLNTSITYIHLREGFDEARLIGQALLCGCKIFCSNNLVGHNKIRTSNSKSIIHYNNPYDNIHMCLNSDYIYDENINSIYSENNIKKKLESIYNECNYNNIISLDNFIDNCDKINWTQKLPAHFNGYPWIQYKNNNLQNSHIRNMEQYNIFKNYIGI